MNGSRLTEARSDSYVRTVKSRLSARNILTVTVGRSRQRPCLHNAKALRALTSSDYISDMHFAKPRACKENIYLRLGTTLQHPYRQPLWRLLWHYAVSEAVTAVSRFIREQLYTVESSGGQSNQKRVYRFHRICTRCD